jgi:hypothetical protein
MRGDRISLSPHSSASSSGTLSCLPRAASNLAPKNKTVSDIDAAYPRLRREFQQPRVDLRFRDREVPWGRKRAEYAEGGEDDGRRRRDVEVSSAPEGGSNHLKGLAPAALKALAHLRPRRISLRLRLRREDLLPEARAGDRR